MSYIIISETNTLSDQYEASTTWPKTITKTATIFKCSFHNHKIRFPPTIQPQVRNATWGFSFHKAKPYEKLSPPHGVV